MIIDIHSHHTAPYREGIISVNAGDYRPEPGQAYSVGIHPWLSAEDQERQTEALRRVAADPGVVCIGESGVDPLRGAPVYRQLQTFGSCVEVSEAAKKPLVIHCVKAFDIILGLHRDLKPRQQWIIHGFRGKPGTALQLTRKGIALSFGEHFNPETVKVIDRNLIFAETDESELPISEIISRLSEAAGEDLRRQIELNVSRLGLRGHPAL